MRRGVSLADIDLLFAPWSVCPLLLPPVLRAVPSPPACLPQEWIMEKWEEGFYITSVAGSDNNNSLVVMSKGARFNQQSYKVGQVWSGQGWGDRVCASPDQARYPGACGVWNGHCIF